MLSWLRIKELNPWQGNSVERLIIQFCSFDKRRDNSFSLVLSVLSKNFGEAERIYIYNSVAICSIHHLMLFVSWVQLSWMCWQGKTKYTVNKKNHGSIKRKLPLSYSSYIIRWRYFIFLGAQKSRYSLLCFVFISFLR